MPLFLRRFYFLPADIQSHHSLRIKPSDTFMYGGGSRRHNREHSEHLGQSLDQASDVCRRSNMLRKLRCIAGNSYSLAALYEIIP